MEMSLSHRKSRHTKSLRQQFCCTKIRSLDTNVKSVKKIFEMVKKDFIYLGLKKKEAKELQANLDRYIKTISFIIYLLY